MADINRTAVSFSFTEETTPGTPATVSATDFIAVTNEGITANGDPEKLDVSVLQNSPWQNKSKKGRKSATGSGSIYLRAGMTEGAAPELAPFLKAAGFSEEVISETDIVADSTTSVIKIAAIDTSKFKVGQGVLINSRHKNVIVAIASGELTLLKPLDAAPVAGQKISASRAYRQDDVNPKSFTFRKWFAGKVKQEIPGYRVGELAFNNIAPKQVPTVSFSGQGITFNEILETLGVTPSFNTAENIVVEEACLYEGPNEMDASEYSVSFTTPLSPKNTLCSTNGAKSIHRNGGLECAGSLSIYKKDDSVGYQPDDVPHSLYISFHIPSGNDGEKSSVIHIFIPRVKFDTKDTNGDIEGKISEVLAWTAEPIPGDATTFPVISFS